MAYSNNDTVVRVYYVYNIYVAIIILTIVYKLTACTSVCLENTLSS